MDAGHFLPGNSYPQPERTVEREWFVVGGPHAVGTFGDRQGLTMVVDAKQHEARGWRCRQPKTRVMNERYCIWEATHHTEQDLLDARAPLWKQRRVVARTVSVTVVIVGSSLCDDGK
jgi:hypothetical protein